MKRGSYTLPSAPPAAPSLPRARRGRPSPRALVEVTRALAVMASARLPLLEALETARAQCTDRRLEAALASAAASVRRGRSLSDSLQAEGQAFSTLYCEMVRVGEATGRLDALLLRLAAYLERSAHLERRVRLALVYPSVVLLVATAAVAFLLVFIVPTFADMFRDFGAELPAPTRLVLALSGALARHGWLLALMGAGAGYAVQRWRRSAAGRARWDRLVLRLPLMGALVRKGLVARCCRTLGTLLEGGVPLAEALELAARSAGSAPMEEAVRGLARALEQGSSLAGVIARAGLFPPLVVQMITVGEETARLDEMLLHVAAHLEQEVDALVETLTSVIEPVLIVLLGVVLGGILVAMYLPLFDLVGAVR